MRFAIALVFAIGCGKGGSGDTGTSGTTPVGDGFHDPLSRPESPTLDLGDFMGAASCGGCHETHFEQWSSSMHGYAMVDPVYRKLVDVRQQEFSGTQDQFCTQCHSAIGVRSGDVSDGFEWDALDPLALEGVSCESCHKIRSVERTFNAGHVIDPDGPVRGPIADPAPSPAHASEYSELFEGTELCGSCHDVVELSGLNLERPYAEWLESPARDAGVTCQDCHMPEYQGVAAPGAPTRTLHEHEFVGVDVPLEPGFASPEVVESMRTKVVELLEGSATLEVVADPVTQGEQLDLVVTVSNEISGHNLPTGSTFIRQVWLEVVVTDAGGAVVYETGTLDANGDLRNAFSELDPYGDVDLVAFSSGFVNAQGAPEIFPWRATEHFSGSIPPLHQRTVTLFVPTQAATGPLTVSARVRFRTHAPFLLRALDLGELVDDIAIYDLDAVSLDVPLL